MATPDSQRRTNEARPLRRDGVASTGVQPVHADQLDAITAAVRCAVAQVCIVHLEEQVQSAARNGAAQGDARLPVSSGAEVFLIAPVLAESVGEEGVVRRGYGEHRRVGGHGGRSLRPIDQVLAVAQGGGDCGCRCVHRHFLARVERTLHLPQVLAAGPGQAQQQQADGDELAAQTHGSSQR